MLDFRPIPVVYHFPAKKLASANDMALSMWEKRLGALDVNEQRWCQYFADLENASNAEWEESLRAMRA